MGFDPGGTESLFKPFTRMHSGTEFEGNGIDERAIVASVTGNMAPALEPGHVIMRIDPRYFRPAEVETLLGDPKKAKEKLGWEPEIKRIRYRPW